MSSNYSGVQNTKTVVELSMSDLKKVVSDTLREERERIAEEAKKANEIDILSRAEVCKILSVSFATLNRWEKTGYLIPVRAGRKVHYLKDDVKRLISK